VKKDKPAKAVLIIAIEESEKALPVARCDNNLVLVMAAQAAIQARRAEADAHRGNSLLGVALREDAERLERTLRQIIPDFPEGAD
jgi:hypothetical protein